MPKLKTRVRAAARALHYAAVADRAHSDGRGAHYVCGCDDESGQCQETCRGALRAAAEAEQDFAEAETYDHYAAEAAAVAGNVGPALDTVRGAREEFAREYARWHAYGAEETTSAEWARQINGEYVQQQLEIARRRSA